MTGMTDLIGDLMRVVAVVPSGRGDDRFDREDFDREDFDRED